MTSDRRPARQVVAGEVLYSPRALNRGERVQLDRMALEARWLERQERQAARDRRAIRALAGAGLAGALVVLTLLVVLVWTVGVWTIGAAVALLVLAAFARPAGTVEIVQRVTIRK